MAHIFKKNKIKEIVSGISSEELMDKIELVKRWHNDYHKGSLKSDKETSREQAFNQDFFVKVLGYEEKPAKEYSLEPKATTEKGQLPDVILGLFNPEKEIKHLSAVVELKGANISLDKPQQREGNMSPIQQAFKYKTQYRSCPFVLVSNFWEFRLFQDNQLDYEIWNLDDLVNPENDYFEFKKFHYLLNKENFTSSEGLTKTQRLLSEMRSEQEEISKKFYDEYKNLRLELLRDLYRQNELVRNDIEIGIKKAQKIIDRIVFVCFCEDRGLLPDDTLLKVLKLSEDTYGSFRTTLQGLFEGINSGSEKLEIPDGYDGGLFEKDSDLNNLQIADDVLKNLVKLGKYNFEEDLSVSILGHIFEQSITDLEEIKEKASKENKLPTQQTSQRKKHGIFYTPDYIVDYIVENSLGALLREKEHILKNKFKLKDDIQDTNYQKRSRQVYTEYQVFLQNIKVLDPACGSGAFLVRVVDYLLEENKRVDYILGGTLLSGDEYIKSVLTNNIFGVDLNSESVEITKLSLWLKTAKKGRRLTHLDNNIKCGNSLINDTNVVGDKAFDWQEEFKDIFDKGGFDVVLGNPPYVRQELIGPYKPYLEEHYVSFSGTTDLFAYFYELGLRLMKDDGYMSYISNNFFRTTGGGETLRTFLQENAKFEQVVDFGTQQIFAGATTYPVIFVFRKNQPTGNFAYLSVEKEDLSSLQAAFQNRSVSVGQGTLNAKSWIFENGIATSIRNKLLEFKTIKEQYGKSYRGILTGLNEAFIIDQETRDRLIREDIKSEELIKPFWEGRDIQRWASDVSNKYVIVFPQGITKLFFGKVNEFQAYEKISQKYPALISQISTFEEKARKRYDKGDYWWELRSCAYYKKFESSKITWPNLQVEGKFCWDDSGKYINAPAVILPTDDKSLLGVLNSKLVWFFLSGICVARSGGYLEVKPQYFSQIPISPKVVRNLDIAQSVEKAIENTKSWKEKNDRFKKVIMTEYKIDKWGRALSEWWNLEFDAFVKVSKLAGISLKQKDELFEMYNKYSLEISSLIKQIKVNENDIDKIVFDCYGLSQSEVDYLGSFIA